MRTGVTFTGASSTSVLMQDPRSDVSFESCDWTDNDGEAVLYVNGTYEDPVPFTTTTSSALNWAFMSTSSTSTSSSLLDVGGMLEAEPELEELEELEWEEGKYDGQERGRRRPRRRQRQPATTGGASTSGRA